MFTKNSIKYYIHDIPVVYDLTFMHSQVMGMWHIGRRTKTCVEQRFLCEKLLMKVNMYKFV